MRFYVATSLSRAAEQNRVRDALVAMGHTITYDWSAHGSVQADGPERCGEVAAAEIGGVANADFVVVLLPGGRGTHAELGAALLGSCRRVFVHAANDELFMADERTCAFYHHPKARKVVGDLLDLITHIAKEID